MNDWPNRSKVIELGRALINGGTCAIIGKRGTGKTQAACWIACQLQLHGYISRTYYFTAADLFGLAKSWYSIPSGDAAHNQQQLWTVPLLVIDEMQERVESEHEDKLLSQLIDKRYGLMQPTLMIANIQASEMPTTFGSSVVSRLTEDGVILVCDWPSFREQIRTKRKDGAT